MQIIPVPNQSDNYAYLLVDEQTKEAAAIDIFDVPKVTAKAKEENVNITSLLTTHHHRDHSGGNAAFVSTRAPRDRGSCKPAPIVYRRSNTRE